MSTIAVGDIHGNVAALSDLLGQVGAQVAADDVVVFLGDYIDRGANTKQCVDAILAFAEQTPASVWPS
jgi:serine/threonine protein phosphatase 1